jgi:hypothetical protein
VVLRARVAAFEVNFVTAALTEWRAQLSPESYKQATRKWLVRQGYSQSGGIIMSFEGEIEPCDWVTRLRMLQDTSQLEMLIEQIEAEDAKKAKTVAQLLPRQKDQRSARRSGVTLLGRMASSSPRADIRGVGQQLFNVKVGRKSMRLSASEMSVTAFRPSDNSPQFSILYQKMAEVSLSADKTTVTVRTQGDGHGGAATTVFTCPDAAALQASIQAHMSLQ